MGRPRRRGLEHGRDKRFVVSKQSERTTFEEETEMANREKNSQKFTIKSGVTGLRRRKLFGIKGKGLPMATDLLLKDSTNMGVRSVPWPKTNEQKEQDDGEERPL